MGAPRIRTYRYPTSEAGVGTRDDSTTREANLARSNPAPADPGQRTVRVISTFVQSVQGWQTDARRFSRVYRGLRPWQERGEAKRLRQLAATAELLGVPVGLVTGVREEPAP